MMSCITRVISPAPWAIWQTVWQQDCEAVPYQSPAWFDALCASSEYADASRLYEMTDGRQIIVPLVRRRKRPPLLNTAASLPNSWGMGRLVAATPPQRADIAAILHDLAHLPYARVSIRPNPRLGAVWAAACPPSLLAVPRLAHVLDLEGGFDKVWRERFSSGTRKAVRRAERAGLDIEYDTTGRLVPVFYQLLTSAFERWARQQNEPSALAHWRGRQRDSLGKFRTIAAKLGAACQIWMAWHQGEPAAAMLVLCHHNVNDARGAMNEELANATGANNLLQKLAIEEACRHGCRYYHMGESGTSAGLAYCKSRFGAVGLPYAEYHLERVPITTIDRQMRGVLKRLIRFRDVQTSPHASPQSTVQPTSQPSERS
jgi:hypothetical protein